MLNSKINIRLIEKIHSFFNNMKSLKYLDPNLFDIIDLKKTSSNILFEDFYLEYINNLPKLDFENTIKISREVYKLYGKENEFDYLLDKLLSNHNIEKGSLIKDDDNCILKASESRILLSGTCYDVVLICHELGHKLRCNNSSNNQDIMDSFLFETPSIIFEIEANNYLRDNFNINIEADELRKNHIMSLKRDDNVEFKIFQTIMNLMKNKKLTFINLYLELIKNQEFVEFLNHQDTSIENCIDESISLYSYDIGYILSKYLQKNENKIDLLNMILEYKFNGLNTLFTIDEDIINESFMIQNRVK